MGDMRRMRLRLLLLLVWKCGWGCLEVPRLNLNYYKEGRRLRDGPP